jgi:large subunit ribosomal protein L6
MYFQEIKIPQEVEVEVRDNLVKVKGPKGELERRFETKTVKGSVKIEKIENKVRVSSESENRKVKALIGTIIAHIRNMITGVTKGFVYKLRGVYSHFPFNIKVEKDKILIQNFLGERVPRVAERVENVEVKVDGLEITLYGIDKEKVGLMATKLEQATRITARDRRTFQDGIYLVSVSEGEQ